MKYFKLLLLVLAILTGQTAFAQAIYSIKLHLTDEGKQLIGDLIADYLEENPSKPVK